MSDENLSGMKADKKCSECHYDNDGDCQISDITGEVCIGKCGWEEKTEEDKENG